MSELNNAIQLIRQGQKWEAQRILQELIKTQPNNIQAWFWYVETCTTTERRIQVMETCLKMNPGNPQVLQALQTLQNQQPATPSKPAPPQTPPPTPSQPSSYSYAFEETPQADPSKKDEDAYASFSSYSASYGSTPEPVKPAAPEKKAWEMDPSEYVDTSLLSKPGKKESVRSLSVFDVWMTATTVQDVKAYEDILKDPEAGLGRAFTWMAVTGLITAFVVPVILMIDPRFSELMTLPEMQELTGSMSPTAFLIMITMIAVVASPISSVINLAITGGIQSILAVFFGGTGNYTRTVYAIAAFLAPMTILTSLATIVPVIGQCLAFPLAIYNIVLNVRALRAAHSISTGAAIGVILAPGILVFIFACLLVFLVGGSNLPS